MKPHWSELIITLWEHWNKKLHKQTGSCGRAWEVFELALIPQPQGRCGMCPGLQVHLRGMFEGKYIVKSGLECYWTHSSPALHVPNPLQCWMPICTFEDISHIVATQKLIVSVNCSFCQLLLWATKRLTLTHSQEDTGGFNVFRSKFQLYSTLTSIVKVNGRILTSYGKIADVLTVLNIDTDSQTPS